MENKYTEQIEAYLNNELSSQGRADLEREIEQDTALQTEFDNRQFAHDSIDLLIEDDLRATLRNLEAQEGNTNTAPQEATIRTINSGRSRRLFLLSVAAGVAVLVGFFALQFMGGSSSPEQLAMDYYEQPSFEIRGQSEFNSLKNGLAAMKSGNYANAIQSFEAIPEGDDYYIGAQYNRAHALYLQNDFEAAQVGFSSVAKGDDARYTENAEWYELLACFAANRGTKCTLLLDAITSDEGHSYYKKAQELKGEL